MSKKKTDDKTPQDDAMPSFATLELAERNGVALVTLNRPDVHNAFDEHSIAELTRALEAIEAMPRVRALVLLGAGPSFCAGADLKWMERMAGFDYERNIADARALAHLLQRLASRRMAAASGSWRAATSPLQRPRRRSRCPRRSSDSFPPRSLPTSWKRSARVPLGAIS
jgi:hypothetical protein